MIKHIDSEEVLIAAMLTDYHRSQSKLDGLSVDKLMLSAHRKIYEAMLTLADEREPIDVISVAKRASMSISEVSEVSDKHVSFEHVSYHCGLVVDAWKVNQMVSLMQRQIGDADTTHPSTLSSNITEGLQSIDSETSGVDMSVGEIYDSMMDGILDRYDRKVPSGIKTGIYFIDEFTNGAKPGNLIIIGARPGVGKTTFALQVAINMSRTMPVGFISMEMPEEELMIKITGHISGVDTLRMESDSLSDQELKTIASSKSEIESLNLVLKDPKTDDKNKIINKIKAMHSKHGIKVCVVDYLQLIGSDRKQESRNHEIGKITRKLKRLAMDLKMPIIILSQLNRPSNSYDKGAEFKSPPRPTLTALRDSGNIEQDANIVIFLHNREPDDNIKPEVEMIIAKNRGGQLGARNIVFDKKISKFYTEDTFHG